ncbi:MAG: hypothetical protein Q4B90_01575 [Eubacteriales bacterium]|nr:hypothetical protein [Eubacteriales bacterium]
MKAMVFAVCDREESYAERLAQHLKKKQGIPFEILVFTQMEALWKYESENQIDLLLIHSEMAEKTRIERFSGCVVLLSEGEIRSEFLEYPALYKYQSCDRTFEEMIQIYSEYKNKKGEVEKRGHTLKKNAELIAVYSPVRRCGKTNFALTLGQILAESRPTLYLNLEPVSAFLWEKENNYQADLSDLIYLFRQEHQNFLYHLGSMTRKLRKLDYILPGMGWELGKVQTQEWVQLIEEVFAYSSYEAVVLDVDESVGDLPELLNVCETIYMPVLEEKTAQEKVMQYEKMIVKSKKESLMQKTEKISIPYVEQSDPEGLLFGKMGQFVRGILKNER